MAISISAKSKNEMTLNRGNIGAIVDIGTKTRNMVRYILKAGYPRSRVVNR